MAKKVWQLTLPHFSLGLGLGIIDASLMSLLARLADEKYHAGYGAVYALAQTSVALAYSLGPLMGGELVPVIGFPGLIRCIGFLNLLICPFMLLLSHTDANKDEIEYEEAELSSLSNEEADLGRDRRRNFNHLNRQPPINTFKGRGGASGSTQLYQQQNKSGGNGGVSGISMLGELLPLKSYDSKYVQSSCYSGSYQRFHDQLDSD